MTDTHSRYLPDGSFLVAFQVDGAGVASILTASPQLDAAYDILHDDGMSEDQIVKLLTGCERSGRDPEAFARHLVGLRRGMRERT